ncbi:imidazole glycerol phosphate synthase subunit HisF [Vulcanisaeta souniana]|uniref:Imidazole glycerol phosphate synthase subunit HisF n=1 Tax=Vulcanisaeta souniana JCM 11219 TaxID=1293586 RepID=A0A830EMJ4_9CREN|nr:imidazole glycerol phosphate synthase subunit HisF [Vulcanisaeta souniana]BDR92891.1 imidazole glycerol phosphate synthase cyclase subunit [Vulcanisaeta souniana JCM 11219]GGI85426.1 imidazole glycerol phosphate synthase cyclase subunit [Vulcanisaeta souniana JCM 11219]
MRPLGIVRRIIPCLDVDANVVVKGVNFEGLRIMGDPVELAARYEEEGADEIFLLDITATIEGRKTFLKTVSNVASALNIPLGVGGGIRNLEDADAAFKAGADKVSINTAAVKNPGLITMLSREYGAQSVVVAIDVKKQGNTWRVYVEGGKRETGLDGIEWAKSAEDLGAGELLITSIDADGTRAGYDVELYRVVSKVVNIPVIASGGAGGVKHFVEVLMYADAALAASVFHMGVINIQGLKAYLMEAGIKVRM